MSVSLDEAFYAIHAALSTAWPQIDPTVPMVFLNTNSQHDPAGAPFVLVRVEWTGGEQVSLGSPGDNLVRRYGNVWFDAFVPIGVGQEAPLKYANDAANILECESLGEIVFMAMEPGAGSSGTDDGLYYGQSVNVPFYHDDRR